MPFKMKHDGRKTLQWKVPPDTVDYSVVLPIFIDGLREVQPLFEFVAYEGAQELIKRGGDDRLLPILSKLILPLKRALNSKDPRAMRKALHLLQVMVKSGEQIGEALVPYYRQLLPIFNIFKGQRNMGTPLDLSGCAFPCVGHEMDFGSKRNLGAMIEDTLTVLETHGGEDVSCFIEETIARSLSVVGVEPPQFVFLRLLSISST
ncbi:hypothetical protein FOZ63_005827 [Perkinsus olseni]|nr:hypothetical protein FOZ63_005827 [Perkinsus olseni]